MALQQSRRLGFSLGVNLLPAEEKTCNFDCLYCECGWTPWMKTPWTWFPTLDDLEETLKENFPILARRHPSLDTITFSGNGEPTLYPEFPAAVNLVRELRKEVLTLGPDCDPDQWNYAWRESNFQRDPPSRYQVRETRRGPYVDEPSSRRGPTECTAVRVGRDSQSDTAVLFQ